MELLERDIEHFIFQTPCNELRRRGLEISGLKVRQPKLGIYGRCDIITIDKERYFYEDVLTDIHVHVFELKRGPIIGKTILQAMKYMEGIKKWREIHKPDVAISVGATLIGNSIDMNELSVLPYLSLNIELYRYLVHDNELFFKSQRRRNISNYGFSPYKK